ncbi:MAG: hypothetical protein OEZ36_06625, partial [Spirochaetota bacterium]|nr:hypothetical protein [Spirochaetota bacterium]
MKLSSAKINEIKKLCSEIGEMDGIPPKEIKKLEQKKIKTHKAFQLSKQAERALSLEWHSISLSELWEDTIIHSVENELDSSKLVINVIIQIRSDFTEKEVLEELKE